MPKKLERKLRKQASKKGLTGKRRRAYIYGTLRKMGWKPDNERKAPKQGTNKNHNPKPRPKKSYTWN